ncbi:MAG: GH92 family glycosyl hydrolase [Bacteroidaceae bacterium]|nr:GH92 family glycosyl hydrolase [Bacteroidaceae bacterium]
MRLKTLFLPLLGLLAMSCDRQKEDVLDYVNPNLGTVHSRWFVYTPASEPFGLAKLGASTNGTYGNKDGWEAVGYEDGHNSIDGFPCLHEFQVGGVALMPITGEAKTRPGLLENPEEGWRSTFQKSDEVADAGYYSVVLQDYGIRTELTATARVGYQRYTFPASEDSHILLNIGNRQGESGAVRDARIEVIDPQTVQGYVVTEPEYVKKYQKGASVPMYFYACFDTPFETTSVAYQDSVWREGNMIQGPGALMLLNYKTTQGQQIVAKIGLSYTSVENARLNLETEAENLTFDEAREQTQDKWREQLGRIRVQGGTQDSRVKFYTGLYHCLLGRGLASDVNGAYPRNDGTVGQIALDKEGKPVHNHYNTDAIWGGYWNLTPLWALAYPEYYSDFISSQLLVYQDAGWLGDGIACSKYVSGVGTNMVSIAMAGAYQSGIRNYDIAKAYEASLKNELEWQDRIEGAGKTDVGQFVKLGYVPFDTSVFYGTHPGGSQFSASHTLEYSFSAYAVAQWAKALGKEEDYARLMELSRGWEKLFNDSLKLIHPRNAEGQFIDNFNPLESWRGFQEGNSIQYTFFVPQNPSGLVGRVGKELFNHRLDSIFTVARDMVFGGGKVVNAFSGLASPYNHGNQPSLHISWLFNFSGKPWLTQKWTRLICDEFYGVTGEHGYGYGQDEDQGQLGSWYVLAAMGLFDVQGGVSQRPTYQLGSPQFERIEIDLKGHQNVGRKFVIETKGNGPGQYYVQSASLNGKPFDQCWLYRDELYKGGKLELQMGAEPNEQWGVEAAPACPQ